MSEITLQPPHEPSYGGDEPWTTERGIGHWYDAAADFAQSKLIGNGKLLVVGSPVYEALEMQDRGWDVTFVDIRKPPVLVDWVEADVSSMPFPDCYFDAITSTCVLCHVGLGRYGDEKMDGGDAKALVEMHRVLKKGGKASLCFGPVSLVTNKTIRLGTAHRIYALEAAMQMARNCGFTVSEVKIWDVVDKSWKAGGNPNVLDSHYLMALLSKD